MSGYFVYILASQRNGTFYVGVTNNLVRRIKEHKDKKAEGFSAKYGVNRLVYYEVYGRIEDAIAREKRLKKWERSWKLRIIEEMNPDWRDLYNDILLQ